MTGDNEISDVLKKAAEESLELFIKSAINKRPDNNRANMDPLCTHCWSAWISTFTDIIRENVAPIIKLCGLDLDVYTDSYFIRRATEDLDPIEDHEAYGICHHFALFLEYGFKLDKRAKSFVRAIDSACETQNPNLN